MSLKRKLERLESAGPRAAPVDPRVTDLRAMMGEVIARQQRGLLGREPAQPRAPMELPGELRSTPHGDVHVVDQYLEPHHCHGRVPVAGALSVESAVVAKLALDPDLEGIDPRKLLLLDTETTGLSGGAGTIPFLIGLAWFEDQSLRLHQLMLRRPGEEAPMLRVLAERLEQASVLVTYNGKAFDWPIVRTRYVLNRVPMPPAPRHLDLLHCARRVLKRRLGGMRLVDLEERVLGMRREDDVDGADIPELYFRYVREGDASLVAPVIEHNANDLIALAAVMSELCTHFATLCPEDDPRDHLGYACVAERADDSERADAFAWAAAEGGGESDVTVEACLLAARLARRRRDVPAEERAITAALSAAHGDVAAAAHLAMAKLCEHRLRDSDRALDHARQTEPAESEEAGVRRVARLERRLARAQRCAQKRTRR